MPDRRGAYLGENIWGAPVESSAYGPGSSAECDGETR
jgi:hypothetical protein